MKLYSVRNIEDCPWHFIGANSMEEACNTFIEIAKEVDDTEGWYPQVKLSQAGEEGIDMVSDEGLGLWSSYETVVANLAKELAKTAEEILNA